MWSRAKRTQKTKTKSRVKVTNPKIAAQTIPRQRGSFGNPPAIEPITVSRPVQHTPPAAREIVDSEHVRVTGKNTQRTELPQGGIGAPGPQE